MPDEIKYDRRYFLRMGVAESRLELEDARQSKSLFTRGRGSAALLIRTGAALLAAGGGLVTVLITEWIRARAERRRFATALYAEVLAMWEFYYETVGRPLESWKDGQPLRMPMHLPEYQNVFAVYNASMDKLGLFAPQEAMLLV